MQRMVGCTEIIRDFLRGLPISGPFPRKWRNLCNYLDVESADRSLQSNRSVGQVPEQKRGWGGCPGCGGIVSWRFFPLCRPCMDGLLDAPSLCARCGSVRCVGGICQRLWAMIPAVVTQTSRYLLSGPTYEIVKMWKITGSPLLRRRLLQDGRWRAPWGDYAKATGIVPVPQGAWRSWHQGGVRTHVLARWIQSHTGIPFWPHALRVVSGSYRPQARLNRQERLGRPSPFALSQTQLELPREVVLVDDFRTTGVTLRQASAVLIRGGVERIHLFTLGSRLI